jgi:HK97 family phage portal protein
MPKIAGHNRGQYARTTPNMDGGMLLNSPDGWVVEQGRNPVWWVGSDQWGQPQYGGVTTILPALSRATSLVSEPIGAMPIRVVDVSEQHTHPLPRWLEDPMLARPDRRIDPNAVRRPNDLTRTELVSSTVATMLLRGNAYWLFVRGVDGQPIAGSIRPMNPSMVTIEETQGTGRLEYNVNGEVTEGGILWVGSVPFEIMHFRGQPPYDEHGLGYGVLDRHARALGLAQQVRDYAGSQMTNGVPPGYLKVSNPNLSPQQAAQLKAAWMEENGGSKRSIAVLNATTDFHAVNLTPVDAQMIDMMKMSLLDVALACGVEPSMLGVSADSNTYANVESRQIQFHTFTLLPYVSRIEDTWSAYLPHGVRADIVMRALLRADTQTRVDTYAQALRDDWMSVNEVRVLEGLEPVPGGDTFKRDRPKEPLALPPGVGSTQFSDNKGGVATLAAPRNSNPEKVA